MAENDPLGIIGPNLLLKRFRIQRYLGGGGYGCVYQGYDHDLRIEVALKIPKEPFSNPLFVSEAQKLRKLAVHVRKRLMEPNCERRAERVPSFYELHEIDGRQTIVLEFCRGGTIGSRLVPATWESWKPLPQLQAAELMLQAAEGLEDGHELNYIHRDVKPTNIFLTEPDPSLGTAKLGDFGVAKDVSVSPFAPTDIGTPAFTAPEIMTGVGATKGSDVYSFGVTLYYILSGFLPFASRLSKEECAKAKKNGELVPISERTDREKKPIDKDLQAIVTKAVELDPERRYPSAKELREDLKMAYIGLAVDDAKRSDPESAELKLKALCELFPFTTRPHLEFARFYANAWRVSDAATVYEQAGRNLPKDTVLMFETAFFTGNILGNSDAAIALMDRAITQDKGLLSQSQRDHGQTLLGKWRKARSHGE